MAVIQRSLVSDQVFKLLASDILSGRYEPDEKLPPQRVLAAEYGVNMTSVREAVKRLEQMRLLEVRQGDAMRVRDWRVEANLDVITHLIMRPDGVDRSTLDDVFEARRLLLTEVARQAACNRTGKQAELIADTAHKLCEDLDAESAQRLDWDFYTEIVEAAGNVVFTLIVNSIKQIYFEFRPVFEPLVGDLENLKPRYLEVADAISAGDGDTAAEATSRLALEQQQLLEKALGAK